MGFDWRGFATGFLERTQEIRERSEEEAKTFEEEQRAAAERNAQTLMERNNIANRAVSYSNYLSDQGVSDAQIQAAIASGPEALAELTQAVEAAVQANNGRRLSPSDVDAIMTMPAGFTPLDMTREEFINRTFGVSAPDVERGQARDPGIVGSIFGFGQMDQARERLNRTPYMNGMTIEQINRAAQQANYTSLIPGTFVSFAGEARRYTADDQANFLDTFDSILDDLENNPEYNRLLQQTGKSREEIEAERRAMQIAQINPFITSTASGLNDPQDFMDAHEAQLRIRLGDAYVDQLRIDLGIDTPEPEEGPTTDTAGLDQTREAIPTDTQAPAAIPSNTPVAPPATDTDVDQATMPPETPPEAQTTVTLETGDTYTYAEWMEMSRSEREQAGLPTSFIGGQIYFKRFGVGLGTVAEDQRFPGRTPEETTITEPTTAAPPPTPVPSADTATSDAEAVRVLTEELGADEGDIQYIRDRAIDMINFIEDLGVTPQSSDEEIAAAIARYAGERQIGLPKDLNFVARVLRSGMLNMSQQR